MDEVTDPTLTLFAEGHQWYWSYQYPKDHLLEFAQNYAGTDPDILRTCSVIKQGRLGVGTLWNENSYYNTIGDKFINAFMNHVPSSTTSRTILKKKKKV
jgi:heme/copper-type cytochrome/quinol oxidase subunit 2